MLFLFHASGSFSHFCLLWEDPDDGIGRRYLAGEIQMCINVACSADITVPQPLLNLLQAHAIGIEQTGAGRGNGYASSGVRPENPGNAGSGNRAESAFQSGLHGKKQERQSGAGISITAAMTRQRSFLRRVWRRSCCDNIVEVDKRSS